MDKETSNSDEEIYSIMFSSLKHPSRRKILRLLSEKPMTFSQLLDSLGISSSHLTYHIENLGELLTKTESGEYKLSTFGVASVETMRTVEEAPAIRTRNFLALPPKWKVLLSILIIGMVLLASMSSVQYATLNQLTSEKKTLESKYEQLLSWSAGTDKSLAFLRDVIQINIDEYKGTLLSNTVEQRADLGGTVEQVLQYSLRSSGSEMEVVLRFRNGKLSRYQIDVLEGSPIYVQPQPYNVFETAADILRRFRSYEDAPYLGAMSNILASVNKTENVEITEGNLTLRVLVSADKTELDWLYTENGVAFLPKSLILTFENHILKEVTDGWFLFTVGSTEVNVSQEEAIEIARNAAQAFKWNADGVTVSNFNILTQPVTVLFNPTPREEPLALVPYWSITFYLDKAYPGNVDRIAVGVWADTKEIADIRAFSG